jgi:uncharacterized protein (DUF111 family)
MNKGKINKLISLTPAEFQELKKIAVKTGRPLTKIINNIISNYLKLEK